MAEAQALDACSCRDLFWQASQESTIPNLHAGPSFHKSWLLDCAGYSDSVAPLAPTRAGAERSLPAGGASFLELIQQSQGHAASLAMGHFLSTPRLELGASELGLLDLGRRLLGAGFALRHLLWLRFFAKLRHLLRQGWLFLRLLLLLGLRILQQRRDRLASHGHLQVLGSRKDVSLVAGTKSQAS